ncbi:MULTISPECIES: response regulator [Microbispora]|uniref:Response regulator n=3 Tax=Microbispora TaxID=2005 RepID=A0ABY3M5F5_9ACTN|nr:MULTISPECIES: response regulator [Microbispora]GLW25516.1 DNA-binding response regulator [Microbispora amethystogenes]MBO4270149.1 response regulator [Microbispora triticiradicis]RGA06684.1 response regulator [Microbispora triticiradicis]TLP66605.1 response regulator [Microbispora fusca]TYB67579.1 response regulator [Microbispora tritici]
MTRVLVVDDEPQILRALRINLVARHYEVATAADGGTALRQAAEFNPDLVLLDLGLPDLDGVEVIHGLRGWSAVPIVVLSGRAGNQDKVDALDAGADDYVTKPFHIEELLARIRAVTRRTSVPEAETARVSVGDHVVDLAAKTVSGDVRLTPTEWRILQIMLRNPGKLISQRQLLTEVWGSTHVRETHYLRQYLAQLRKKLERDPARPVHLITEPGMGYRFTP